MTGAIDSRYAGDGQARYAFQGPNLAWVLDLYDQYLADPNSVDAETRAFFADWTPPAWPDGAAAQAAPAAPGVDVRVVLAAAAYAQALRAHGHRVAAISPVGAARNGVPELQAATHGLTEADLARLPADVAGGVVAEQSSNALEAIERLREAYCGTIGYEFDHVQVDEQRRWLRDAAESGRFLVPLDPQGRKILLERLTEVEAFEKFLHTTYLGAKRFSIEGTDTLVPVLDEIISGAALGGTEEIVIGMAHRGRLNVLTHILGKPYEAIFREFEHGPRSGISASDSSDIGWTGDVKYHLGARRRGGRGRRGQTVEVPVIMAPNPSHLEYVNPIVEGMARASQDDCSEPGEPIQRHGAALAILIHGDAAFPGQGIVAETLNLSGLKGYETSGTIHIIVNNQVGFTTDPDQARSTLYASDLAKGFEIPIVHVNADDPEACLAVARMAVAYRSTFRRDFLIDLVGYRRWGHNETDEPSFTQPALYAEIAERPTVRALLARQLEEEGTLAPGEGDRMLSTALDRLQELKMISDGEPVDDAAALARLDHNGHQPGATLDGEPETGIPEAVLRAYNDALHTFPPGFTLNPKLERQLVRRRGALDRPGGIDWALAESLAFAGILSDGTPIRFTGQDVERGTFSHRHLVLHDPYTSATFTALQALPTARASFEVHNSPLSEAAVLGFEYGYSVYAPEVLVLWEAQFGDFANSAQVIIDQFIAAAQAKWLQTSSLVMLLPHGYEGQGPEHSSARIERFLQLAAGGSLSIANCTTSAQYFHLLRRQAKRLQIEPRPLVVFTPKSLLRHPMAGSSLADLVEGRFQAVLDDPGASERRGDVTRVIMCSGKVYVDLMSAEGAKTSEAGGVAVVRLEQLHPFPAERIAEILRGYPAMQELVWVQEEPRNMGAWRYVADKLEEIVGPTVPVRYIGRPERASPAEGSADAHAEEQARIIAAAWSGVLAPAMRVG